MMSESKSKKYARTIKKNENRIVKDFTSVLTERSFHERLEIAIKIILGKRIDE